MLLLKNLTHLKFWLIYIANGWLILRGDRERERTIPGWIEQEASMRW